MTEKIVHLNRILSSNWVLWIYSYHGAMLCKVPESTEIKPTLVVWMDFLTFLSFTFLVNDMELKTFFLMMSITQYIICHIVGAS